MKNKRHLLIILCLSMILTSCNRPVSMVAGTAVETTSKAETTVAISHTSAMTTAYEITSTATTTETVSITFPPETEWEDDDDYDRYVDTDPDGVMTTAETEPWYAAIWFTTDVLDIEPYWDTTTAASETNEILYAPPETYLTENTTAPFTTTYETISKPMETTTTTTASTTVETETPETIERSEEFIDDYTHKYYYQNLTDDQKEYYRYCFDQRRYMTVAIEPQKSDYDKRIALIAFNRDNPHLLLYPTKFSIDNGYTSMTEKKRNKILKTAKSIADKAKQHDREFDKIKTIHDELNAMITYESGHEMVSAFLEGKADCSGYADAFCMVCQLAEIECVVV